MKKFLVLFLTPASVLDGWMQKSESERKEAEDKMKVEWNDWMAKYKSAIVDMPAGAGKTKKVTKDGATDSRNNVMMYAVVQAASPEEAAQMFVGHPHLGIPESSIEVMAINAMA